MVQDLLTKTNFLKGKPTTNIHSYNVHQLLSFKLQEITQIPLNPFPRAQPTLRNPQQTAKTDEIG